MGKNIAKMLEQHITNGNCKMPCSGILGYTKPCSGLRPLQGFVPPHFCSPGLATQALIRAAKTSVTLYRYTTYRQIIKNNY